MSKYRTGLTVNGIQETCKWVKPTPCPRHRMHVAKGQKMTFTIVSLEEPENANDSVSLEDYNSVSPILKLDSLTEEQRMQLNRQLYIKIGDKFYRKNSNGYTLDEFRHIESAEYLTEEEFNHVLENGYIVIDEAVYRMEANGYLDTEHKDVDAPYMRLQEWLVESANMTVPEYIETYGDKNNTLDYDIEQAYMNGGCAVYALALQELNPQYQLAMETFEWSGDGLIYNHVFCINPDSGESYDARGKFSSPEALYDYASDPLTPVNPTNAGVSTHQLWGTEQLQDLISEGFFTYDDTDEDIELTKQLITKFKTRF